jgi:hypothetical protein
MSSAIWLDVLLWGLGDRLDGKQDYRTDALLVVNLTTWLTPFIVWYIGGTTHSLATLVGWFLLPFLPSSWIGTQVGIGVALALLGRKSIVRRETEASQWTSRKTAEADV